VKCLSHCNFGLCLSHCDTRLCTSHSDNGLCSSHYDVWKCLLHCDVTICETHYNFRICLSNCSDMSIFITLQCYYVCHIAMLLCSSCCNVDFCSSYFNVASCLSHDKVGLCFIHYENDVLVKFFKIISNKVLTLLTKVDHDQEYSLL